MGQGVGGVGTGIGPETRFGGYCGMKPDRALKIFSLDLPAIKI